MSEKDKNDFRLWPKSKKVFGWIFWCFNWIAEHLDPSSKTSKDFIIVVGRDIKWSVVDCINIAFGSIVGTFGSLFIANYFDNMLIACITFVVSGFIVYIAIGFYFEYLTIRSLHDYTFFGAVTIVNDVFFLICTGLSLGGVLSFLILMVNHLLQFS